MTKDVLQGSRHINFADQQAIVADLSKKTLAAYEVPKVLEAAVCIFAQYFSTEKRLFSGNPLTYTRCQEKIQGYQVVVGGFALAGLNVDNYYSVSVSVGVAALRKF